MEFKILDKIVKKGGVKYVQIERFDPPKGSLDERGNPAKGIALYAVYGFKYSPEKISGYEVFKIRIMKGGEIGGNKIAPGEKYPSNEDIGKWGLAFHGKNAEKDSKDYFNKLKEELCDEQQC